MNLTIRDESATGILIHELTLDGLTEVITVRELIRSRIYQEVQDCNFRLQQGNSQFKGLVTPTGIEQSLNGPRVQKMREIDWKEQFGKACKAFERNGVLILVDNRQAESLDESITLRHDTRVSFIKLTPLVGG